MADQVVALMQEAMKKVVMEKELEVVSAVQATLVPDASVVQLGGISLAGYFRPATQCGGDWWNYYRLAQGKVMVVIGDVTGHGAASAMITAAAKGAATTITDVTDGKVDLTLMLRAMNTAINDAAKGRFVMTCFAAIYDERTHVMAYANAGHNFPYMCDEKGKITPLVARGNRLGDVVGSKFEIREAKIAPGTMIVWYTDGIVEGENEAGEEYGERRFRHRIKEYMKLEPDRARDELVQRANEFFGTVPPADDITLIVGKFS
jgi:serine phosphatase RsbU (regulator of sigma subunit)